MLILLTYFIAMIHRWSIWWRVAIALAIRRGDLLLVWLGDEAASIQRARFGIHAFIGENGSGKTNLMMKQAQRALDRGQTVISSVPIYIDKENRITHPLYVRFDSWEAIKEARDCVLVLDEVKGMANATEQAALPPEIQLVLNQCRKRKMKVYWSSPAWEDAQVQLRRITRAVTLCRGSWSDKAAYKAAVNDLSSDFDEAWIPNRLFHARTYRKPITPDFKVERHQQPDVEEYYWGPGSRSFDLYDTNEETTRLMEAGSTGLCMSCQGTKRRDECICVPYVQQKAERQKIRDASKPAKPARAPRGKAGPDVGYFTAPGGQFDDSFATAGQYHDHSHAGY